MFGGRVLRTVNALSITCNRKSQFGFKMLIFFYQYTFPFLFFSFFFFLFLLSLWRCGGLVVSALDFQPGGQ